MIMSWPCMHLQFWQYHQQFFIVELRSRIKYLPTPPLISCLKFPPIFHLLSSWRPCISWKGQFLFLWIWGQELLCRMFKKRREFRRIWEWILRSGLIQLILLPSFPTSWISFSLPLERAFPLFINKEDMAGTYINCEIWLVGTYFHRPTLPNKLTYTQYPPIVPDLNKLSINHP